MKRIIRWICRWLDEEPASLFDFFGETEIRQCWRDGCKADAVCGSCLACAFHCSCFG